MAAAIARPVPVLPLVGSTIVPPGWSEPAASHASIKRRPMRSLTLPPGLSCSHLTSTSGRTSRVMRLSRTSGVWAVAGALGPVVVSRGRLFAGAGEQAIQLLAHRLNIRVRAIDAREADISDVIQPAQAFHHHLADDPRRNLDLPHLVQFLLDLVHDGFELAHGDRPLLARAAQTVHELVALEGLTPPVALDHRELREHHPLDGAEALEAALAAAPAMDGATLIARIRDTRLGPPTVWAFHPGHCSLADPRASRHQG